MAGTRGKPITDEQIERIKSAFANGASIRDAAKAGDVGVATAIKFRDERDGFERVRTEKRLDIIATTAADFVPRLLKGIAAYAEHIMEPGVVGRAGARDSAIALGTLIDKVQLLTGEATERSEHVDATAARDKLAHTLDELASRRATRGDQRADGSGG